MVNVWLISLQTIWHERYHPLRESMRAGQRRSKAVHIPFVINPVMKQDKRNTVKDQNYQIIINRHVPSKNNFRHFITLIPGVNCGCYFSKQLLFITCHFLVSLFSVPPPPSLTCMVSYCAMLWCICVHCFRKMLGRNCHCLMHCKFVLLSDRKQAHNLNIV